MHTKRFFTVCGLVLAIFVLAAAPVLADEGSAERIALVIYGLADPYDLPGAGVCVGHEALIDIHGDVLRPPRYRDYAARAVIDFGDGTRSSDQVACSRYGLPDNVCFSGMAACKTYHFDGTYFLRADVWWDDGDWARKEQWLPVYNAQRYPDVVVSPEDGEVLLWSAAGVGDPEARAVALQGWVTVVTCDKGGVGCQVGLFLNDVLLYSVDGGDRFTIGTVNLARLGLDSAAELRLRIEAAEGSVARLETGSGYVLYQSGDFSTVRYVKLDEAGWVRGRVVTATVAQYPVAGVIVCVGPKDPAAGPWSEEAVVTTGGDGSFAIYLPRGKHRIRVYGRETGRAPVEIHLADY